MAYSGAWLNQAGATRERIGAIVHTADPAHGVGAQVDPGADDYTAPPLPEVAIGEFPGSEWVIVSPGNMRDHSNYDTHEADSPERDSGASRDRNYAPPITQFADERYSSATWAGLPGQHVNPVALQRGLNSLPENNPDGFDQGTQDRFTVDRKFAIGQRVHDRRIVTPNTAAAATNVPAGTTQNESPFDSLARAMTRGFNKPGMRREPTPPTNDIVDDGSANEYPAGTPSWVVM